MPTIDTSQDYLVVDNTQTVLFTFLDGSTLSVDYCLQEGISMDYSDHVRGAIGYRTFCVWHVWKEPIRAAIAAQDAANPPGFIQHDTGATDALTWRQADVQIQIGSKLTDKNGFDWYVARVHLDVWGTKYMIECEGSSGMPTQEVDLP